MSGSVRSVAILGGGPAASTLGALLAREGLRVGLFYGDSHSPILVGESLVPGVVPMLRELDVEQEIKSYSQIKPGARFYIDQETEVTFYFDEIPGPLPDYAYNVPRDRFNRTLREGAREAGVETIPQEASLIADESGDPTVRLEPPHRRKLRKRGIPEPDLIVDATGRARLLTRLLELPVQDQSRRDKALFTHFDRLRNTSQGLVHTDRLEYGWCWRIPLADRVSFGVVMDEPYLRRFGDTPVEKLEGLCQHEDRLRHLTTGAERLEQVLEYENYQSRTARLHGRNWVLLGDAAGFIDPVFASGLYLAMNGARTLARALTRSGIAGLETYASEVHSQFQAWTFITRTFYNGRLLALLKTGQEVQGSLLGRLLNPHMEKHMGRIFTGLAAESPYSMGMLRFMTKYGLAGKDPKHYNIGSLEEPEGSGSIDAT